MAKSTNRVARWFQKHKDWFNPARGFTTRLRQEGKKIGWPRMEEVYRFFVGNMIGDPHNKKDYGRHAGIYDYLTLFIPYAIEAFLRGHWRKDQVKEFAFKFRPLTLVWGIFNIARAVFGILLIAPVAAVLLGVLFPVAILGAIGIGVYKIVMRIKDPIYLRFQYFKKAKHLKELERANYHHLIEEPDARNKPNLYQLANRHQVLAYQNRRWAWVIRKRIKNDGSISYDQPQAYDLDEDERELKRLKANRPYKVIFEGSKKSIAKLQRRNTDIDRYDLKVKPARKNSNDQCTAPYRLELRFLKPPKPEINEETGEITKTIIYYPDSHQF